MKLPVLSVSVEVSFILVWFDVELFSEVEISLSTGFITGTGILPIASISKQIPASGVFLFPINSILPIYISKGSLLL